jgi:hypothetical protein
MEVFFQLAILLSGYWLSRIDGLQKVLMKHLFPGCSMVALEHVLKLCKGVGLVKVVFFCSLVKLRDGLIDSELDAIIKIVLMDFYLTFVVRVVTLKFIDFRKVGVIVVPGLHDLIQGHLLVDQGHIVRRRVALVFS